MREYRPVEGSASGESRSKRRRGRALLGTRADGSIGPLQTHASLTDNSQQAVAGRCKQNEKDKGHSSIPPSCPTLLIVQTLRSSALRRHALPMSFERRVGRTR